jgi:hypothetical protein
MADKKATLHVEGKAPIELPIMEGSLGTPVIDVRKLGANGYFTFDPGFLATTSTAEKASCFTVDTLLISLQTTLII